MVSRACRIPAWVVGRGPSGSRAFHLADGGVGCCAPFPGAPTSTPPAKLASFGSSDAREAETL